MYVGLLRPPFPAPLSPNDPLFLMKIGGSHSMTPIFLNLSPKASIFFNSNSKLVISNDSVYNHPFKVRNLILGACMGLRLSPKD